MINKSEKDIMKNWNGDVSEPIVSICCVTYNHETLIAEALDSFLMQETTFPFEIVITEDCSPDNTASIIKKYIDKFPNIINANLRNLNVGHQVNVVEINQRAKGKYIALCEGDDYWTDENKLQIQIDVLEKNQEVDMCLQKAVRIDGQGNEKIIGDYLDNDGIIPAEDIILKTKGYIPTASTVYRQRIAGDIAEFHRQRPWLTSGTLYTHIFGAMRGGAYFMNESMSVYRHELEGSWSSKQKNDYKKKLNHAYCRIKSFEELDVIEMNQFTTAFKEANKKRLLSTIFEPSIPYFDKIIFTVKHEKYLSVNEKIAYYGFVLIPFSSYVPRSFYRLPKKILNIRPK